LADELSSEPHVLLSDENSEPREDSEERLDSDDFDERLLRALLSSDEPSED